jgi:hypothetical protein
MRRLRWLLRSLFGCRHADLSRVFTIDNRSYQVCFECAEQIDYSLERMRSDERTVAAAAIKSILNGVVVIAIVFWLLNISGLFHSLSRIRVGP